MSTATLADPLAHPARYSPPIVDVLAPFAAGHAPGLVVDAFAGTGSYLDAIGANTYGVEIQPGWAAAHDRITCGDALDPSSYRPGTVACAVSPCYGNRMADGYLGTPHDGCGGEGCAGCEQTGRCPDDRRRRRTYAIAALGMGEQIPDGSVALAPFTNDPASSAGYRLFHERWLDVMAEVLPDGADRLAVNMKDHWRHKRRQYAIDWWVSAARQAGFRLTRSEVVRPRGYGFGANMHELKVDHEVVLFFDLDGSDRGR